MPKYRLHEYIFFFAGLIFIIFLLGVSFYASQTRRDINSKAVYDTPTPGTSPTSNPQSPTPTPHFINLACYACAQYSGDVKSCGPIVVTTASSNTCGSIGYFSSSDACVKNCGPGYTCFKDGEVCGLGNLAGCCHGSCYQGYCRYSVPPTPFKCSTAGVPCTSNGQCCNKLCLPTYIGKVCN